MALTFLARKPDRGLGNVRSSPGDPVRNVDWVLMVTQGLLTVIGCMVVYSASRTRLADDPYAFVNRQVVFAIIASVVMAFVMTVDYEWFKERAAFLYGLTIALLLLLLLMGIAQGIDRISFDLGPFNFQPAEMAKFTTLIALCAYLADERSDEVTYARFLGGLILVGAPAVLTIAQPDLGSASVIVTIAMGVLLVAGAKAKYIALVSFLSIATVASAFIGGLVNKYQVERLRVFLDQETTDPDLEDAAYQVRNAIRAVGTGGVWGKGWLEGDLTNRPLRASDVGRLPVRRGGGAVRPGRVRRAAGDLRGGVDADLADRHALARPARHLPVRRRVHDAAVAGVPERGHDARDHARDRSAAAVHLVRRVEPDHVLRHVRHRAERAHETDAVAG